MPFKKDVNHLTKRFVKRTKHWPYHIEEDQMIARAQLEKPPYSFEITKADPSYDGAFEKWETRFNLTQQLIASLASEETLRQLFGQRFDELVRLHGTILVRTPEGTVVHPPMYLHQRPMPLAPLTQNAAASSSTTEAGPSTSETLKRKNLAEDQENQEPSAKRVGTVEVIDLSESP